MRVRVLLQCRAIASYLFTLRHLFRFSGEKEGGPAEFHIRRLVTGSLYHSPSQQNRPPSTRGHTCNNLLFLQVQTIGRSNSELATRISHFRRSECQFNSSLMAARFRYVFHPMCHSHPFASTLRRLTLRSLFHHQLNRRHPY